jgi:glycosyltransferase involved in cell wall biosynthesis
MRDLSILIPSRNEMFLLNTIQSILDSIEADTEVIAVCDGAWPLPAIPDHPRVTLIHHSTSIGQRASTNEAARLSNAKYIMKCDAHCSFDKGFDAKLMKDCEKDWTVIPRMYNLHVFDWMCKKCGNRTYQGVKPAKCEKKECDGTDFEMVVVWKHREHKRSDFARFDRSLHFQYWGDFGKRPEAQGDIADLMCFVGACFFMHRERYFEIEGLDEKHGSWGQMGVEISCKSWLSGGRQVVNKKTWFSHMFRTQPGFGFPYPISGRDVDKARSYSRWLWEEGNWKLAKRDLAWLIKKFAPVPEWDIIPKSTKVVEEETGTKLTKGLVYYTDNKCDKTILESAQKQLIKCTNNYKIMSVSLLPISFGQNIVMNRERGILTMFKQILAGLEALDTDIAFLVEHDILYHPSHFEFVPPKNDVFYYNENTYKVDAKTGQALFYYCKQTSGLCAYRSLLIEHYRRRIEKVEQNKRDLLAKGEKVKNDGYSRHMGFEPGCHTPPRGVDNYKAERWMSESPNIDIRHDTNLTPNRWNQDQFRDKNSCLGWMLTDSVPGWGITKNRFSDFLKDV